MDWLPSEGGKYYYVYYKMDVQGYVEENWSNMQEWLVEHILKLERAITPYRDDLDKALRNYTEKIEGFEEEQEN